MTRTTHGKSSVSTVEADDLDLLDWEAELDVPEYDPVLPEAVDPPAGTSDPAEARPGDALYPVALLKIAMAMKRFGPDESRQVEALLGEVLEGLDVDHADFRRYLDKNLGHLRTAVRTRGY